MRPTLKDDFLKLEKALTIECPSMITEALTLSGEIANPLTANPRQIWEKIWDKPLFANTKVEIGEIYKRRLLGEIDEAWTFIGVDPERFKVNRIGSGLSKSSFQVLGKIAINSKIAGHRLYSLQNGAMALKARCSANPNAPYSDLNELSFRDALQKVKAEMGFGWGNITVSHFLTDIGLAVKPDFHLVNTIKYLGLPVSGTINKIPNQFQTIEINNGVRELLLQLDDGFSPNRLRYLDKVLMEIDKRILKINQP